MYTQCKLQFEPFDGKELAVDTVWIPTKFAEIGKEIILDKPEKRRAKVLQIYATKEKVERKKWNNNI